MDDTGRVLTGMADWNREMMRIERDVFVQLRNSGRLSEEVMREVEYGLDLEEALLDQRLEAMSGHLNQLRGQQTDDPNGPTPT
jgi:hypothetical protein